jgi:very-short-patch-repair endonuclease
MQSETVGLRVGITALLTLGGFVFPILFIPAAFVGWTVYDSLKNPPPPEPDAWFARRWTATEQDPEWKSYFLPFCESPAEVAFLEAILPAYRLLPEKGILKGSGLTLNLQVKVNPYRLDFLADEWLAIEIDGAAYHSSPAAVAKDRERDRFLEGCGYKVLRIPAEVVFNEPQTAVARVRAAIAAGREPIAGTVVGTAALVQGQATPSPSRSLCSKPQAKLN